MRALHRTLLTRPRARAKIALLMFGWFKRLFEYPRAYGDSVALELSRAEQLNCAQSLGFRCLALIGLCVWERMQGVFWRGR